VTRSLPAHPRGDFGGEEHEPERSGPLDLCNLTSYTDGVIRSFAHKGLERYYATGNTAGIQAKHAQKLRLILTNLDQSESPVDMDLPSLRLHELKGNRRGIWAVSVSGNWRITFRFSGSDAEIVDYEDYH
jgi:proteic killer suppression protein